jgi:hypothetical protein
MLKKVNKQNEISWLFGIVFFYLFLSSHQFANVANAEPESEQLIAFLQPGASAVDDAFQRYNLPLIKRMAQDMGVSVHIVDARKAAPKEVAITPLIVYQNHRGRSIYQGRTTTPNRIRNFIRTSRFVPQGRELNRREDIPIWQDGRARLWAPLKVSAVTGTQPADYDNEAFIAEALTEIAKGFKKFRMQKFTEVGRADRGFYMDFFPWLSQDQTLYLSLALYSQFHCKAPIYKDKIIGSWKERRQLLQQAAHLMEKAVVKQINDPKSGDSFDPVKNNVPEVSWEKIGFPLPPAPKTTDKQMAVDTKLPQKWVLVKSGPADPPMIQFRFPAPLDNYAGEVTAGKGEPVLDEAIRGSVMLYSRRYPTAKFMVESIKANGQSIAYGRLTPASVSGTFSLKGKSVPLTSKAEFEPIIGENGQPNLLIRGIFKIDLRVFDIAGADGPAPAKHTLLFDVNFILIPKDDTA